ncbi:MAG: sugar ABC transporter permease [Chloroflexota bacterium]
MVDTTGSIARPSAPTSPPLGRSDSTWLERNAHLVMPLPAVLGVVGMLAFPLVYTLYMSFQDWTISSADPPVFIGVDNYVKLFTADPRFLNSIWVTFYYTIFGVTVQTLLGVTMALLFNRQFWGRGVLRALAILPMVATPVAISLIFVMMYHPQLGILNFLLKQIGMPPWTWTYASSTAIPALVIVDTWQWTPLIMLICLAGLAALPHDPYESAMIDGASRTQMLWYITLPLIRPSIITAVLFRLIDSLKSFDVIFVMTQGGPGTASDTINLYLFNTAFSYFRMGQASAMVVVFFTMILGIAMVVARIRRATWT